PYPPSFFQGAVLVLCRPPPPPGRAGGGGRGGGGLLRRGPAHRGPPPRPPHGHHDGAPPPPFLRGAGGAPRPRTPPPRGRAVAALIAAQWGQDMAILAAAGAILGHCFPVWLKFNGGKGVATALGILIAIAWPVGLLACATWLVVATLFRYSSLAALAALALA